MDYDYDLFVIGGGSGGVRGARMAALAGARVGIAEEWEGDARDETDFASNARQHVHRHRGGDAHDDSEYHKISNSGISEQFLSPSREIRF